MVILSISLDNRQLMLLHPDVPCSPTGIWDFSGYVHYVKKLYPQDVLGVLSTLVKSDTPVFYGRGQMLLYKNGDDFYDFAYYCIHVLKRIPSDVLEWIREKYVEKAVELAHLENMSLHLSSKDMPVGG